MATVEEIRKTRTGLIVKVFKGFKVRVRSSGKSWILKKASLIVEACS